MNRAEAPYLPLTNEVVDEHLRGEVHIGLYPLGDDDTCWWVAADFDKEAAMLDALAYMKAARSLRIPAALEVSQSGRGAHVWIFFAQAICCVGRSTHRHESARRGIPAAWQHASAQLRPIVPVPGCPHGPRGGQSDRRTAERHPPQCTAQRCSWIRPHWNHSSDQLAYLSSIARLSANDVATLARKLPDPQIGQHVRRLQLPTSSKIVPRPAAIIRATFGARITVNASDLGPAMISAVKHAASIRNPEFDARQRARRSTWDTPRFLCSYDETVDGDLVLPRGLLELTDGPGRFGREHTAHRRHSRQRRAAEFHVLDRTSARSDHRLAASPCKGHGCPHRSPGLGQDCHRLCRNRFSFDQHAGPCRPQGPRRPMARPDQKHLGFKCGQIGGGRSKTTGVLDIALLPTLARREQVEDITAGYGFVIVDECHHVAASAFFGVLNRIPARYWLGLTATPERRDGLEDLIYHQLGSHHVALESPGAGATPGDGYGLTRAPPRSAPAPHSIPIPGDADPSGTRRDGRDLPSARRRPHSAGADRRRRADRPSEMAPTSWCSPPGSNTSKPSPTDFERREKP